VAARRYLRLAKRLWRGVGVVCAGSQGGVKQLRICCGVGAPLRVRPFVLDSIPLSISSPKKAAIVSQKNDPSVSRSFFYPFLREEETYQRRFSNALGSTVTTTTRLVIISATVTAVTRKMLPLLAGNLPRMIQYCVKLLVTHFFLRGQLASAPKTQGRSVGQGLE